MSPAMRTVAAFDRRNALHPPQSAVIGGQLLIEACGSMPGMQQTLPDPREPALISFWLVVRLNTVSNTVEGIGSSFPHDTGDRMSQFYTSLKLVVP